MLDQPRTPHLTYRNNQLSLEEISLPDIANTVPTPFYAYSLNHVRDEYQKFEQALVQAGIANPRICYAVKANSSNAVLTTLAGLGSGADIVSGEELDLCLAAGINPDRIIYSGTGKTDVEIKAALQTPIYQINVEAEAELDLIQKIAADLGTTANIALRLNPGISTDTHAHTQTGEAIHKFGITFDYALETVALRAKEMPNINLCALSVHIGSQVHNTDQFRAAYLRVREAVEKLRAAGHTLTRLDIGGGIGISYQDDETALSPEKYAQVVMETVGDLGCELAFEPGRYLVGNAGVLVTRVLTVKEEPGRPVFVVVDAGMNTLIRPAMYSAYHSIIPVEEGQTQSWPNTNICGAICESGDTFMVRDYHGSPVTRHFPKIQRGDLLVIQSAGAYGYVMASPYNKWSLPTEVVIDGSNWAVSREAFTLADFQAKETTPAWLGEKLAEVV